MRTEARLEFGQKWRLSDPRRLSAFMIVRAISDFVVVVQLYPDRGQVRRLPARKFLETGPKGYTQM